ncbi:MAG: hypothetical protein K5927_02480 [Lachnospiraceae bacterium]|nr:hypothetical protein [Lachnospiraceae bacterium]
MKESSSEPFSITNRITEKGEKLMRGGNQMNTREINIAMLSAIPEKDQEKIYIYLSENYFNNNPLRPLSAEEIYAELEESRKCFEKGEYDDFDDALGEIEKKYGL